MENVTKALWLNGEKPYSDMGDLVQIARAEACKILHCSKVKVLNILPCNYPLGYVAVVQVSGGKRTNHDNR
jgi:hypothetical protein